MTCPCPDPACDDVHAHDVTCSFVIELPPLSVMLGLAPERRDGD